MCACFFSRASFLSCALTLTHCVCSFLHVVLLCHSLAPLLMTSFSLFHPHSSSPILAPSLESHSCFFLAHPSHFFLRCLFHRSSLLTLCVLTVSLRLSGFLWFSLPFSHPLCLKALYSLLHTLSPHLNDLISFLTISLAFPASHIHFSLARSFLHTLSCTLFLFLEPPFSHALPYTFSFTDSLLFSLPILFHFLFLLFSSFLCFTHFSPFFPSFLTFSSFTFPHPFFSLSYPLSNILLLHFHLLKNYSLSKVLYYFLLREKCMVTLQNPGSV